MKYGIIMKSNTMREMLKREFVDFGKIILAEPIDEKQFEVKTEVFTIALKLLSFMPRHKAS